MILYQNENIAWQTATSLESEYTKRDYQRALDLWNKSFDQLNPSLKVLDNGTIVLVDDSDPAIIIWSSEICM